MTASELVHTEMKRLHAALDGSLRGLTPEQRHMIPHPRANSIAWVVQVCVSHGMTHVGEIELLRTVVGARPVRDV